MKVPRSALDVVAETPFAIAFRINGKQGDSGLDAVIYFGPVLTPVAQAAVLRAVAAEIDRGLEAAADA